MKRWMIVVLVLAAVGIALYLTGRQAKTNATGGELSDISYEHSESYSVGAAELSEAVEFIDISWPVGSVTVMTHSSSTVSFSEENVREPTEDMRLRYWLDGTTLRIRLCGSGQWRLDDLKKALTVRVPENLELTGLNISGVSTAICLDAIRTKSADISTTSGSVRLTDCIVAEQMRFSSVSGKLDAQLAWPLNSFQSSTTSGACRISAPSVVFFHAETVSGTVQLSADGIPGQLDISTISGNVGIALPKDASFTLAYYSISGDLSSTLPYTVEEGRYRFGSGKGTFGIVTVSGDVHITVED